MAPRTARRPLTSGGPAGQMTHRREGHMGGILAVAIVALIVSQFAYRQFEPHRRAIFTAGTAWVICAVIGGSVLKGGFLVGLIAYSIGAVVIGIERYVHYSKHWTDEPGSSDLTDTFR